MYKLIVKNKEVSIIDRLLTNDECESISGTGTQWICDAFVKYIGLDINDYTISEYYSEPGCFTLNIREEDLTKLREDKLNNLIN